MNEIEHQGPIVSGSKLLMRPHARRFASPQLVSVGGANVTGVNPWWDFKSGTISGVGKYSVNVATGNLFLQGVDVVVPHRSVTFGFARAFNSYSQHDWNNTDQSGVNNYGDGWTNSFDMHIAQNSLSSGNGISVFDQNGARYDYQKNCGSSCVYNIFAPLGQHAILTFDHNTGRYYWTDKTGTVYMFHNVTDNAGIAGRLAKIWFRNNDVQLVFTYAFDQGASPAPATLNTITAKSDATNGVSQSVALQFSNVSVSSGVRRLLTSLTWPDGQTSVSYKYDTSGRLIEVDKPTNSAQYSSIPQTYQYLSGGYTLNKVMGGRWNENGSSPAPSPGPQGGSVQFNYTGYSVNTVQSYGYINPLVADDSSRSSAIQTTISSSYGTIAGSPYRQIFFAYSDVSPAPTPPPGHTPTGSAACTSSGNTPVYDSDGHDVVYCWDSSDRVVQISAWTGSIWLVSMQAWDSSNDLVSTTDPRGFETDAAYDTNGNVIAMALPAPSPGAVRPTTNITHDASNNVVAVCDPVWSDANGAGWGTSTPAPNSSPCPANAANSPSHPGPTLYAYSISSPEPFGELSSITKPYGYLTSITYGTPNQGGNLDYGQPAQITGQTVSQGDGSSTTPTTQYYYNDRGEVICVRTRGGTDLSPTWNTVINTYSSSDGADGRITQSADADDSSLGNGNDNVSCPKTPGIPGSTITRSFTYFSNGQVATDQSPNEWAAGVATAYAYDADGENISVTAHFGSTTPATATKAFDADGRLVEVVKPGQWDTRYDYDLTQNETVNSDPMLGVTTTIYAHGGLFKTQEYHSFYSTLWVDMKGSAYDALLRDVGDYTYMPNASCSPTNYATCESASLRQFVYDGSAGLGMMTHMTDPVGTTSTITYDNDGRPATVTYSDGTIEEEFGYDLDGRVASQTGACAGHGCDGDFESYAYNRDGNLSQKTEQAWNNSDPTTLYYGYNTDDHLASISASPEPSAPTGGMNQSNLVAYSYFADNHVSDETLNYGSAKKTFNFTYTNGGRPTAQADPLSTTSETYSPYAGTLTSATAPEGSTTFNSFDPEGETTSFTEPNQTTATTQGFDSIGDLGSQTPPGQDPNGCTLGFTQTDSSGYMTASSWNFNSLDQACEIKQMTGTEDVRSAVQATTYIQSQQGWFEFAENYIFDADGRMTTGWNGTVCCGVSVAEFTRGYDANNHFVKQHDSSGNLQMQRTYAPDGRINQIGTADSSHVMHWETLHWSGDTLLFTTNQSGQVDDVKIGSRADYFPLDTSNAQLTVWDRDYMGHMRGCHNAGGASLWSPLDPYNTRGNPLPVLGGHCTTPAMYNGAIGQGGAVLQPDGDGYWDGYVMIQGLRDYDSQFRGWIEPDPTRGTGLDPMTQKAYTWNNNNPSSNSDPSGMRPPGQDDGTGGPGGGPEWIDAGYYGGDDNGDPTGENLSSIAAFFASEQAAAEAEQAAFESFAASTSYSATFTVTPADGQLGRVTSNSVDESSFVADNSNSQNPYDAHWEGIVTAFGQLPLGLGWAASFNVPLGQKSAEIQWSYISASGKEITQLSQQTLDPLAFGESITAYLFVPKDAQAVLFYVRLVPSGAEGWGSGIP